MHLLMHAAPRRQIVEELLHLPDQILRSIDQDTMYDLIQCIDWMQVDPAGTAPIAPWIEHKSKGGRRTKLYLPRSGFSTVSGLEYAMVSDLYEQFKEDRNSDVEAKMIAILVRPAGTSEDPAADPRTRLLSSDQAAEWLPLIRSLPDSIRAYITTLISANIHDVYTTFKEWLFVDGDKGEEQEGLNFGWWGMFMDIAEDGTFGTYDQVLATNIHTLCGYQSRKVEEARRQKQEHDHALARANT